MKACRVFQLVVLVLPTFCVGQIDLTKLVWNTCGACPDPVEVAASGPNVSVGVPGRLESDQQNTALHVASALLPPAKSYTVTFQYSFSTWDSYNAPGTPNPPFNGGTGYWDSFSVSVSSVPYWQLTLGDPLTPGELPGLGFLWGGPSYGDGNLKPTSAQTAVTLNGDPKGQNYLNIGLDTATQPDADTNYPSWGTFVITEITTDCGDDIPPLGVFPYYQCGKPFQTQWWSAPYDNEQDTPTAISSLIRDNTGTKVTATANNHGLAANDFVIVSGATPTVFNSGKAPNGVFQVTSATANTFTYAQKGPANATGTGGQDQGTTVICEDGCAMTALAMALSYHGFSFTPATLNTALIKLGAQGYTNSGLVVWWDAVNSLTNGTLEALPGDNTTTDLDADLCAGNPVILHVGGHFVLATGKGKGTYSIADPGHIGVTSLTSYGNSFISKMRIVPPGSGAFVVYANSAIQVMITDPLGRRLGYNNGVMVNEIVGGQFYDEGIRDDNPSIQGDRSIPTSHVLFIPRPADGFYTLTITGMAAGPGQVEIYRDNDRNRPQTKQVVNTNLNVGEVLQQNTTYSTRPGDLNSDGYVDQADLAIVQASFGKKLGDAGFDPVADVNGDGIVDIRDLAFVSKNIQNFNQLKHNTPNNGKRPH